MTSPEFVAAAERLARVLDEENAALAALDFGATVRLATEKAAAMAALTRFAPPDPGAAAPDQGDTDAKRAAVLLHDRAERNRALLEQAIAVQRRVIATVARALPRPLAAIGYAASGRAPRADSRPMALRSQA